jgi:hypothetical protein
MMTLVDDHERKVRGQTLATGAPRQRADAGDDDRGIALVPRGLDDANGQARGDESELV